ncbi:DEAD/DEAH box helicase domain protein [Isosphaera pallida ATCC 43644]|uniref:DEAD/DEAH box helicase domain protein n=1 Tax=Isosphaera pallida (strain ATCC 43644 / DSM 9630 / IS1B) TaxID=575540 RepID=E8QYW5_ISOPI|nr:DEAD/DEAH box helicase [Isosphaera pallida]ADV62102.1 DEAD/DEAH box helicase domain protein [Isosphaera pallida ATCC 43644]
MIQRIASSPTPPASFAELGLSRLTLAALKTVNYRVPSPIQAAFIPPALEGRDVIGQAKTGTGKTAAFSLPLIEMHEPGQPGPQAIILAPTRELVQQICGEFERLARGRDLVVRGIYGGEPIERQLRSLAKGVDVVVGTPGRVIDHLQRGTMSLEGVYHVVLDEADRMLDIGFRPDIERILRKVPQPHQTLLLSATLSPEVRRLAARYMHEPVELNLSRDEPSVEKIVQKYIPVDHNRKMELLLHLLELEKPRQCIVFCRTKRGADKLAQRLARRYPGVATIHGDLPQTARNRVMRGFRDGSIPILVATDVVGRGIDVEEISHVVNYDIPDDPENYLHRIGRTGRMGKDGVAYTFVGPDEGIPLTNIEVLINKTLERVVIPGFEVTERGVGVADRSRGRIPISLEGGYRAAAPKPFRQLFSTA